MNGAECFGNSETMGNMSSMMGKMAGTGFNPMEMCKVMMKTDSHSTFATPELRGLFNDWVAVVEQDLLAVINKKGAMNLAVLAQELKISEESALYLVSRLIRGKKLKTPVVELAGP